MVKMLLRPNLLRDWGALAWGILVALLVSAFSGHAASKTLALTEHLDRNWTDEAVSFPLTFEAEACHWESIRLDGPDGAASYQLSDRVQIVDKPFLTSAKIWFVTDLPALERRVYTVRYGPEPVSPPQSETDFHVTREPESVEFTTSRFGIRLRLGTQHYVQPVLASEVVGPVLAMRLVDGTWFGGSDLYGDTKIKAWSGNLVATGPIFGEVRYRYEYEDGNRLDLTVRLFAAADRAQFDTDVLSHNPREGLRLVLSRELPPLTLHAQTTSYPGRNALKGNYKWGDWAHLPLGSDYPPGPVMTVTPWGHWWALDTQAPVVRLGMGDCQRELHVARRDPAAWVNPGARDGNHKVLPIRKSSEGDIYVDVNLAAGDAGGIRRFDIVETDATESVGWRSGPDTWGCPNAGQVIIYREPLNVVKDYILDWEQKGRHPRLFMSRESLTAVQEEGVLSERVRPAWRAVKPGYPHITEERWVRENPWEAFTPHEVDWMGRHGDMAVYLLAGGADVARLLRLPERLAGDLAYLGNFDKMRRTQRIAGLYDAIIDNSLISPEQRSLYRAQMAYLGYQMAAPWTWSPERGWASGNLNMTLGYTMLGRGTMACVLPDHPLAEEWMRPALAMYEEMLGRVGPNGEWPESSGYSHVSASHLLGFAVMAAEAGIGDFVNDPRLKRLMAWLAKSYTPPDPRLDGRKGYVMFGRAGGGRAQLIGAMARATHYADPEYAKHLQWVWKDMGMPLDNLSDTTLGGFDRVHMDPTLPVENPGWKTELFPRMGVIFRQGLGTPSEFYALFLSSDHYPEMVWSSHIGALLHFYAYGQPIGGSFGGHYDYQEEFFVNRVSLARSPGTIQERRVRHGLRGIGFSPWFFDDARPKARFGEQEGESNVSAFSALPRQDYAAVDVLMKYPHHVGISEPDELPWPPLMAGEGEPGVYWRRQVLYVKGNDPADVNYLLLRDTVQGAQPTMWTFWTQSEKVGTALEAANADVFLADKPGQAITPPREVTGDRFTALGRWGVDLEYFVAAPKDTPRYTMRWGTTYARQPIYENPEYQDLLHLQRADDGAYFVALFPRRRQDPVPEFTALADKRIIKVSGTFGTDWTFLSAIPADVEVDGIRFSGTAAGVQERNGETVLNLAAPGSVSLGKVALEASGAVAVRWRAVDRFLIELPANHSGVALQLQLPDGHWQCSDAKVAMLAEGAVTRLDIPEGVSAVTVSQKTRE